MHSFVMTGIACLPISTATPISPRKSNLITVSLMIFPFSSCSASSVPLNNLDKNTENDVSSFFRFLKNGRTDISFALDKIGTGIPVPPLNPAVLLEPAISLIKWKNHTSVPFIIFDDVSSPIKILLFSGTSTIKKFPATSVP